MSGASRSVPVSSLGKTPTALVNLYSTTGYSPSVITSGASDAKKILSGALVAGVLSTVLSISGSGVIRQMQVATMDATARTVRAKLTLDGVVVFDSTSASVSYAGVGAILVGNANTDNAAAAVPFSQSCVLEIASSLTETDKLRAYLNYSTA